METHDIPAAGSRETSSPLKAKLEMSKLSSALVSSIKRYSYEMEDIPEVERHVQINNDILLKVEEIVNQRCKEIEEKSAEKDRRLNELESELQLLKKSGNGKNRPSSSLSRVQRQRLGSKCFKEKVNRSHGVGSTSTNVLGSRSHSATRGPQSQDANSGVRTKSTSAPTSPAKRMTKPLGPSKSARTAQSSNFENDRSRTRDAVLVRKDKDVKKTVPETKPLKKILCSRTNQDCSLDKRRKPIGLATSTPKPERRSVTPSVEKKSGDSIDSTASSTAGDSGDGSHSPAPLEANVHGDLNIVGVSETLCNCRVFESQLRKLTEEHEKLQAEYARLRSFLGERIWDESKITTIVENQVDSAANPDEPSETSDTDSAAPVAAYKQEILRLREEILAIRRQKSESDKKFEEISRHSCELQAENTCLQAQLEDISQQMADLIERLNNVQKDYNEKTKRIIDLEQQLTVSDAHLALVQEEVAASRLKLADLQTQIEEGHKTYNALLRQLKETETEAKEMKEFMQEERNMLSETVADLEKELAVKQKKIDHLIATDATKNRSEDELKDLIEKQKLEIQQLHTEVMNVRTNAKELLVRQGAELSGTSVTLAQLTQRLESTVKNLMETKGLLDICFEDDDNSEIMIDTGYEKDIDSVSSGQSLNNECHSSSLVTEVLTSIRCTTESELQNGNINNNSCDKDALDCDGQKNCIPPCEMLVEMQWKEESPNKKHSNCDSSFLDDNVKTQSISKDTEILHSCKSSEIPNKKHIIAKPPMDMQIWTLADQAKSVDQLLNKLLKLLTAVQQKYKTDFKDLSDQKEQIQQELSHEILKNKHTLKELNSQLSFSKSQKDLVDVELQNSQEELITTKSSLQHTQAHFNEVVACVSNSSDHQLETKKLLQQIQELNSAKNKLEAEKQELSDQIKLTFEKLSDITANNNPDAGFVSTAEFLQEKFDLKNEITQLKCKMKEKDNQIGELSAKLNKYKQIINANWKKAEDEVKRLDDLIDYVLETMNSIPEIVSSCEVLQKLRQKLGGEDFQQSLPEI